MGDPQNASLNGDGFRFYRWTDVITGEETDVLSVTSIRRLCGEPFNLVTWQIGNVINVALGTAKTPAIGKRGGILKGKFVYKVDEFPSEFAQKYIETDGQQGPVDDLRKWLRSQADQPRDVAAMRGTMTHAAIERNVRWDSVERPFVEVLFNELSSKDKQRHIGGVKDEDIEFVRNAVRQYWDLRQHVNFVIIARELQVFNLTLGYAGSFDGLVWMAPDDWAGPLPKADDITLEWVRDNGGELRLADWKTSPEVYTDHILQTHGYLMAEFVGSNGVKDHRMTDLLTATKRAAVVTIRPDHWAWSEFDYSEEVGNAFVGSCVLARLLAKYPQPTALFTRVLTGVSEEGDNDD